ncbi:MAG: thioredoxin domain-containing protein [Gammaproteobacteria bacterium]|nr:thioredoxin domain-containing protein [Gammaproteobacteria bacterium]
MPSSNRPTLPDAQTLKTLPEDGGENWNRLVFEASPYLLQHAANPVDWHPWGDAAFDKARTEDKLVFLSVGYATCHWCHVMEHESFEDDEVAALINQHCIAIKVDREERPDIDQIYMSACQAMTGQGGWPLNCFLTADGHPLFAGTYFPKHNRYRRIGMMELLPKIAHAWQQDRQETLKKALNFTQQLQQKTADQGGSLSPQLLQNAFQQLKNNYDPELGGFGHAPKFPSPHQYLFLLRYSQRNDEPAALAMVEKSLTAMRLGGLFDQIGLGFHRYSTDDQWLLPHFEKMLYDQAMLMLAYSETYAATHTPFYQNVSEEILSYLMQRMQHPEGGFYSAEDADSEGEEGKFYIWNTAELQECLNDDERNWFKTTFQINTEGNFLDESSRQKNGNNIPHLRQPLSEADQQRWQPLREKLYQQRQKRIPPLKDDKILTDWNGLMIAALARSSVLLGEPRFLQQAEKAFAFVLNHLSHADGQLKKRFRNDQAGLPAHLDDYAFMIWAALELHQASLNSDHLTHALRWQEIALEQFWDNEHGGFFVTSAKSTLVMRPKALHDGAIPSGNSVMAHNLATLYHLSGEEKWQGYLEQLQQSAAQELNRYPAGHAFLLTAHDLYQGPTQTVVLSGQQIDPELLKPLKKTFLPHTLCLAVEQNNQQQMHDFAPFTQQQILAKETTLYLCQGFACETPLQGDDNITERLKQL